MFGNKATSTTDGTDQASPVTDSTEQAKHVPNSRDQLLWKLSELPDNCPNVDDDLMNDFGTAAKVLWEGYLKTVHLWKSINVDGRFRH